MAVDVKASPLIYMALTFLASALVAFFLMNFLVAGNLRRELEETRRKLDDSPLKLLRDAEKHLENRNFESARNMLDDLTDKYPDSLPARQTAVLATRINATELEQRQWQVEAEARWQKAEPGIREQWKQDRASQLLRQLDRTRAQLEKDLGLLVENEWQRARSKIRREWQSAAGER